MSSSADFKNQIEIIRCERAVVKAAMDRKNHDGTWSHAGPRVEVLDILCDRLLAARERAKTKKAKGSP